MKLTLNLALPDGEGEYTVCIEQQAAGFLLKPFASWLVFVLTAAPKSFAAPLTRSRSICSEIIDK